MIKNPEPVSENGKKYLRCVCDVCKTEFNRSFYYWNFDHCIDCSNKVGGKTRSTHGYNNKNSRLHVTWNNMCQRVDNPKNKKYRIYGALGVKIHEDWRQFPLFMEWCLSNGYTDDLTLDRIDPAGNYEPSNCRFVSRSIQNANKRPFKESKTGYIGVSRHGKAFRAYINWQHRRIELGGYSTPKEAALARNQYIQANNLPHLLNEIKTPN